MKIQLSRTIISVYCARQVFASMGVEHVVYHRDDSVWSLGISSICTDALIFVDKKIQLA
ncbi:hypothetical protein DPMN_048338 [Dreissena polymorpha]|uniref:Uncharacterized protein n=1 Tax=Dreissena polymorpha TaxID=45954 RepID=A0A9D4D9T1_DREPO|nr:hypothetical protein DPMN_048338 [Dreissena polymorpha]